MIWAPGGDVPLGGVNPDWRDKPAVVDSADASAVLQGNFGAAEDSDMMVVVESGGMQREAESSMVQVQAIAAETVEFSDFATPHQHAEAESSEDGQRARFHLPPADSEDRFRVSDLVWAQLEGHPWWPGEIYDSSDASELALKHQKEDNHLVAFFGDGSFAWCDESQLMPFMENCSQMEKQGNSDAFTIAVNHALQELSRRILSATSCSCLPEELSDNGMSYVVENSGLKAGVTSSTVNKAEMLKHFSPESLLRYVKSLAFSPGKGGDLQDLVIACSQLMSFYRSKGCPDFASFQTGSGWGESGIDSSSTKNVMLGETVTNQVQPDHVKPKRGRGRPRKPKPDANLELMENEPIGKKSAKRRRAKRHHGVNPEDLLGDLCSTSAAPMDGSGTAIKVETTDHMQDAYWSGLSLHTIPIHSLKEANGKTRPRRRRRPTWRVSAPSSDLSPPVQNIQPGTLGHNREIQVIKRSIIHVDEKMVHEVKPTALVLIFGRSTDLPLEMDLIRMFSLYGPLKETETEVHRNTNTVKVVFKKRVDAERAFSAAGKFGSFGPSLRSFRLVDMPFSLISTTELNCPNLGPEESGLKVPAPRVSGITLDSAQVDIIHKADKGESVKKTSVEHAEMVKQAGQDEGTTERSLHAEDINKESPDVLSGTMQAEIVDEATKQSLVRVDAVVEASTDTMEVDNPDGDREQTSRPRDLRAQALTGYVAKQSVEDGYVFQGIEGVKS
uniref:Uncharacterized protein n=1 Tax=Avena sativa TaxID=4498 RepID=A0ACD5T9L1_AVESA